MLFTNLALLFAATSSPPSHLHIHEASELEAEVTASHRFTQVTVAAKVWSSDYFINQIKSLFQLLQPDGALVLRGSAELLSLFRKELPDHGFCFTPPAGGKNVDLLPEPTEDATKIPSDPSFLVAWRPRTV